MLKIMETVEENSVNVQHVYDDEEKEEHDQRLIDAARRAIDEKRMRMTMGFDEEFKLEQEIGQMRGLLQVHDRTGELFHHQTHFTTRLNRLADEVLKEQSKISENITTMDVQMDHFVPRDVARMNYIRPTNRERY